MKRPRLPAFILIFCLVLTACGGVAEGVPAASEAPGTPLPTVTPAPSEEPAPTPSPTPEPPAEELTGSLTLSLPFRFSTGAMLDGNYESASLFYRGYSIRFTSAEPVACLYLSWVKAPAPCTVSGSGWELDGGTGVLQELLTLPEPSCEFTIAFSGPSALGELRAFGPGTLPDDIHIWLPPCEKADVLVFPAHADDETIFFGALIASCVDRGLSVQVCTMVDHSNWPPRPFELLNALWELGVRNYPVTGPFPDYYSMSLQSAINGFGREPVIEWQVEQLRRFRPSVVVGHDIEGEYGHGAHRISAWALPQSVFAAADETAYPASAETYGVWDTPKLYLHMLEENEICLDTASPLASFGGRSAFEVATDAMQCHRSQLQYPHRPTLESREFPRYDCRRFGLIRSIAGPDTGNDLMENISG